MGGPLRKDEDDRNNTLVTDGVETPDEPTDAELAVRGLDQLWDVIESARPAEKPVVAVSSDALPDFELPDLGKDDAGAAPWTPGAQVDEVLRRLHVAASGTAPTFSVDAPPPVAEEKKEPVEVAETFFVSADAGKEDDPWDVADRVFDDFGGMMNGAQQIPEERVQDYSQLTFHDKTAAMVKEVVEFGNAKAFADLREEAGRLNWEGVSSSAATAYHRCCVVKAVKEYEQALKDGDATKQKAALQELAKMRCLRLGTEYQQVHKAIDAYLQKRMEESPELLDRDKIDNARRHAMDGMALDFKKAATAFAQFAVADTHNDRLAAYERFKAAAAENPDQKILDYASRLGDFVGALHLKEVLESAKPTAESVNEALDLLQKTSPMLAKVLLDEVLKKLQESSETKDEFSKTQSLTMDALKELIKKGKLDQLLPQLKSALANEEFANAFKDYENIRNSRHSPANLLRAGLPSPGERDKFDEKVEKASWAVEENNRKYQELERKLLARDTTEEQRLEILKDLRKLVEESDVVAGDSSALANTFELETINDLITIRETKDPAKAAEHLERLQKMADSGFPVARQLLGQLFPGADPFASASSMVERLKKEGEGADTALADLQKATGFVPEELDRLRIRNLTYEFRTDRLPGKKEIDELVALLEAEQKNGNKGAADWLEWSKAAKLMAEVSIGGRNQQADRVKAVDELSQLAKDGNDHARKMLLAITMNDVHPGAKALWQYQFNSSEGPGALKPHLTSVDAYRREYVEAALKGLTAVYEGKADKLGREDALALSLAMGQNPLESSRNKIDDVLKAALKGPKGAEVLSGVFDAIQSNAPGGEYLARTILHGANLPQFADHFRSFVRWAEKGDKVGMIVLAGVLAGRREQTDLFDIAKETILKCASDKSKQASVAQVLLDTFKLDVDKEKKANPVILELMGDVLAKNNRTDIPAEVFNQTREVLRKELERYNTDPKPEDRDRFEKALRGFMSISKYMEKSDLDLIKVTPELAKALKEKDWEIPKDLQMSFSWKLFARLDDTDPRVALECIGNAGKILSAYDVAQIEKRLRQPLSKETETAYIRCLLQIIGANSGRAEVKEAAINQIEKSRWFNNELDREVRAGLSDYVRGRVGDIKLLDKVINIIGDCGVETPMALVVSRLGLPLNDEMIRDVEAGLRNFNGDRSAYLKVLERAMMLRAIPPDQNLLGRPEISLLVKRMADAPLAGDGEYGFLATDQVEKLIEGLEKLHYDSLIAKARESGYTLSASQIRDSVFGYDFTQSNAMARMVRGPEAAYEQSVDKLRQVTRDGHQTSYWWLAAGGAGYLVRRFGPGGTQEQFGERQKDALNEWKEAQKNLGKATAERDALVNGLLRLDTARNVGEYVNQLGKGNIAESDKLALKILARTGSSDLGPTAAFLRDNLVGRGWDEGAGMHKPGEIWIRLKRLHATDLEVAPVFSSGDSGAFEAQRFLARPDLVMPARGTSDKYHDLRELAHDVALGEAFRALDQDTRMVAAISSLAKLSSLVGQVQMLFQEGMAGHRGEAYTQLARQMGNQIVMVLNQLKDQAPKIRQLIDELKEARDKAKDQDAKKGLDARIKQLEDIMIGYVPNSKGETNSKRYNELKEMIRVMNSSDFDAGSFGKWLTDNAGSLILVTTALAGIALIPFSGGASGILTAVAIAALVATVGYVANEAWKEGMHQWGGAAYGSDFLRTVVQLTTGLEVRQTGVRYDPKTGTFQAPPGMDEVMLEALKEIGKETLVNLLGAGFGKLVGVGLKAFSGPARLTAAELTKDTARLVSGMEKVAASNALARNWGTRFVTAWVESMPWAVVGATVEGIAQDELKGLKDNHGITEFMIHAACVCFTVMTHRVGGHIMRPRVIGNGSIEVPYNKEAFLAEMRKQYEKSGKPMPDIKVEGDVAKVNVGGRVIELKFVDPVKVAAELTKNGVKPEPLQPGEVAPPTPTPPERLNAGEKPVLGSGPARPLPALEPGHMSAGEVVRPMHPEGATGSASVLAFDRATPVVFVEPATQGKQATYSRGYAVAEPGGGATLIRFSETPQDLLFSGKEKFQKGDHHKPIAQADGVQYVYDTKARTVLRVTQGPDGPVAQRVDSVRITDIPKGEMGSVKPAIRTEPALQVAVDGQTLEISSAGRRALVIGPGARADIRIPDAGGGAVVMTDGKGFYVKAAAGAQVEVIAKDGTRKTLSPNETVALRSTDKLIVAGKEVVLTPTESQRYSVLPTRNMATDNRGAKPVDMVKTPAVQDIRPGFTYCEELPGNQRVQPRIIDPARDPVLQAFEAEAAAKFAHLKGNDAALMKALTEYVHERMTPHVVDEGFGQPGIRQGRGMNPVAEHVDGAVGGPMMIGDLIARRSAVCLDQAMVLKYLAQRMGIKAEVTTGTWNGQPHAWVTVVEPGGKRIVFDPRNNNQLFNNERGGFPQTRDYQPYGSDNPRRTPGRVNAEMVTDYSSIATKIEETKTALDQQVTASKVTPQQRDAFMSALKTALAGADPLSLKAIGDKLGALLSAADLPQRLPHLTEVLKDPNLARVGPGIEKIIDPKMPAANIQALAEFMKTDAVKHLVASRDAAAIAAFKDNAGKLVHSAELPERLKLAADLEKGLFKEVEGFRLDFVLDSKISLTKLKEFKTSLEAMNQGDMVFAYPEVVQALRSAGPEAARHMVENLPEMAKTFKDANDAVEKLTAMRMVAEASRDANGIMQLPLIFEQRGTHLQDPLFKSFAEKTMLEGLNKVFVDPANTYLFTAGGDSVLQSLRTIFQDRKLSDQFNQAVRQRFEKLMEQGRLISPTEKQWLAKNSKAYGFDQQLLDKVMAYQPPPPKIQFLPGGENMVTVLSKNESFSSQYTNFELTDTTNNGNHLVKCTDSAGRTNYLIVQKGPTGEAQIFRVIDLEGLPLKNEPMFVKHLADLDPVVLKQMGSGLYGDGSVRRPALDVTVDLTRTVDGKPESGSVKAYGISWRVGGGLHRTLMVVTLDQNGQPTIVVVNRCATKAAAAVDGSYDNLPSGIKQAVADTARPSWTIAPSK